ncbi:MAG: hypothetical protein PW734_07695 [Verrucomicrobium sp.]|nr:hypothetical protein [Verrucomicrobium sp.]
MSFLKNQAETFRFLSAQRHEKGWSIGQCLDEYAVNRHPAVGMPALLLAVTALGASTLGGLAKGAAYLDARDARTQPVLHVESAGKPLALNCHSFSKGETCTVALGKDDFKALQRSGAVTIGRAPEGAAPQR